MPTAEKTPWPDLLLTTPHALCTLRGSDGATGVVDRDRAPYAGITWGGGRIFVACAGSRIIVMSARFEVEREIEVEDIVAFHQILWHDGRLLAPDAHGDGVVSIDPRSGAAESVAMLSHTPKSYPVGLWFDGRRHYFVCEHRPGDPGRASCVSVFDADWALRASLPIGRHAHNVYAHAGKIVVTSGLDGALVSFDTSRRKVSGTVTTGGFPRGLARTRSAFIFAESDVVGPDPRPGARLHLIDAAGRGEAQTIDLDPDLGAVADLRAVSELDYAHGSEPFPDA